MGIKNLPSGESNGPASSYKVKTKSATDFTGQATGHALTSEEKDRGNHTDTETETRVHKEVGNLLFTN